LALPIEGAGALGQGWFSLTRGSIAALTAGHEERF
jgi:hypothetical protein